MWFKWIVLKGEKELLKIQKTYVQSQAVIPTYRLMKLTPELRSLYD